MRRLLPCICIYYYVYVARQVSVALNFLMSYKSFNTTDLEKAISFHYFIFRVCGASHFHWSHTLYAKQQQDDSSNFIAARCVQGVNFVCKMRALAKCICCCIVCCCCFSFFPANFWLFCQVHLYSSRVLAFFKWLFHKEA